MQSTFGTGPPSTMGYPEVKSGIGSLESAKPESCMQFGRPDKVVTQDMSQLTHVGISGEAQMVDVSSKDNTKRTALACCKVTLDRRVFDLALTNQTGKGDVPGVAEITGINGAKQTSCVIPLRHNIALAHLRVDLRLNPEDFSIDIEGEASCTGRNRR